MTISYPAAGELLERLVAARTAYDGDAWVDLFAESAEVRLDPFAEPLVGHNALRAYLNRPQEAEMEYELTIERHWVSGDAVLAAWHASWVPGGRGHGPTWPGFSSRRSVTV
jgi:hypothetical protein